MVALCIIMSVVIFWVQYVGNKYAACDTCHGPCKICTKMEWAKNKDAIKKKLSGGCYTCSVCGSTLHRLW
jgi:hypothetical protein